MTLFILFILVNSMVTLFAATHRNFGSSTAPTVNSLNNNNYSSSKWTQNSDTAKYISIEVLSSRDRVRICVDDATVITIIIVIYSLSNCRTILLHKEYLSVFYNHKIIILHDFLPGDRL